MREKQIQIPQKLFVELCQYFILPDEPPSQDSDLYKNICKGIEDKLQRHIEHELYTTYKTAPTEEQKEKARQEYLDKKGILEDFRW